MPLADTSRIMQGSSRTSTISFATRSSSETRGALRRSAVRDCGVCLGSLIGSFAEMLNVTILTNGRFRTISVYVEVFNLRLLTLPESDSQMLFEAVVAFDLRRSGDHH